MKKKLILLPLLMLVLGACASSVVSSEDPISSEPISEEPVMDTNVYHLTGSFYDPGWQPDSEFILEQVGETNVFIYEGLDLFMNEEWAITINGDWAGQIGFTGTSNLSIVDSATTMGLGGGFDVKNFKVLTDGNYDIELDTTEMLRVLTITRNGDPVDVPTVEEDTGEWHLVGSMNGWDITLTTFPLVEDDAINHLYSGEFALEADTMFKVATGTDSTWTYARGSAHVETDDPVPAWLDIASDSAIKILEAGNYKIDFYWIASIGATVNGAIVINKMRDLPVGYYTISEILAEATLDKVYTTRGVVVALNGGASYIQDASGAAINLYTGSTHPSAPIVAALTVGDVIDAQGVFKIYNTAAELDTATLTVFAAREAAPIEMAHVIADEAELIARMGTSPAMSGQLVRLNGVTAGAWGINLLGTATANNFVITFGATRVQVVTGYSAGHEATSTNRAAVGPLVTSLNTGATTFDLVAVLYHSSTTPGTWRLQLPTTEYFIVPTA